MHKERDLEVCLAILEEDILNSVLYLLKGNY
jgi:hypothetical protein